MPTININVGGLWRTTIEITETTTWYQLAFLIQEATGLPTDIQLTTPSMGEDRGVTGLTDGDELMVEWRERVGNHPLHYAARDENVEAIRSWVASGADVNVINTYGSTPLMFAALNWRVAAAAELMRLGAEASTVNEDGENALHFFAQRVDRWFVPSSCPPVEEMLEALVTAGLDPEARDNRGHTAYGLAYDQRETWRGRVRQLTAIAMAIEMKLPESPRPRRP